MNNLKKVALSIALVTMTLAPSAFSAVTQKAKAAAAITVVTEVSGSTTNSTSYVDLPGAVVAISVPTGKKQLVQVRLSGESYCFGYAGLAYKFCTIRILEDGHEMLPNSGSDFAFDTNGQDDDAWEANSMERTISVGPGSHLIQVQYAVMDAGVNFTLDDWSLTITQYNKN